MHYLCLLAGISDKINDSTVSATNSCHSPQATSFAVRLENCVNLVRLKLTTVVDCVKGVCKGLLADSAEVTLTPFASSSVFVGPLVAAE